MSPTSPTNRSCRRAGPDRIAGCGPDRGSTVRARTSARMCRPSARTISVYSAKARSVASGRIERAEIGGEPSTDRDRGPQDRGHRGKLDAARGDGPLRFPGGGLTPERLLKIISHDGADDDQRELHLKHAVREILRRLRHPQREAAEHLAHEGDPDIGDQLVERGVGNALEKPEQAKPDDEHEPDDRRRPECVNGQRERPTERLIDPCCVGRIGQPVEHVHSPCSLVRPQTSGHPRFTDLFKKYVPANAMPRTTITTAITVKTTTVLE